MANGKITLGKQSGGTLGLVFPDGVSNTEVVLPESGVLVSVGTTLTDNAIVRFDGTTGRVQNSSVTIDDSGLITGSLNGNASTVTNGVYTTGNQTIAGAKTFSGLSKTSIGDNALEVITSSSNIAAGSFMVSQGAKYGLALNGVGTELETGIFGFQVIDRDLKTVKSMPFSIGIHGVVSYYSFPVTPSSEPTTNYQVANKKYVDDNTLLSPNDSRVKTALNATGNAPIYACRAWVNFNGAGTVAIRASGNISSITDNGVGNYTVNFTTAMPDANYCTTTSVGEGTTNTFAFGEDGEYVLKTVSSIRMAIMDAANRARGDSYLLNVAIFR